MTEEVATKEEKKLDPKPEPKFEPWSKEERESSKDRYCCEILVYTFLFFFLGGAD